MNKAAVLENLYFQRCNLNINNIDVVVYFSKLICHFLLICFQAHMCKILVKSDKIFLSYSNLFGIHFLSGHSVLYCGCNVQVYADDFCNMWCILAVYCSAVD